MSKKYALVLILLFSLMLTACFTHGSDKNVINAAEHGVSAENTGEMNSKALQAIIDEAAFSGKTVYIPAGEYEFAQNGTQTIGAHCIKMRSGVSIVGDGEKTVLKPVGHAYYGLDMFYFNDYVDEGTPVYLENCRFESFVIDGAGTSCTVYTSAGKGFMFNLFRNCHFKNVTVKNTDASGFGVDCPIDSSITGCAAINCGKATDTDGSGASGFGIGFGYSEDESITISDCQATGNKKFGFFFEHQGRFKNTTNANKYNALPSDNFTVTDCYAEGNLYGFGGINTFNTVYDGCTSKDSLKYGYYFENSFASMAKNCRSSGEKDACFSVLLTEAADGMSEEAGKIEFLSCEGKDSPIGFLSVLDVTHNVKPALTDCRFSGVECEQKQIFTEENIKESE